jgi:hypothetical protein
MNICIKMSEYSKYRQWLPLSGDCGKLVLKVIFRGK